MGVPTDAAEALCLTDKEKTAKAIEAWAQLGVGQNVTIRNWTAGFGLSIYQGSILGTYF